MLCKGNIDELFDLDIKYLAMCNEISGNISNTQAKRYKKFYPESIYCNAGMILFNVESLKRLYTYDDILNKMTSEISDYEFLDQDFLNLLFKGKIDVIDGFRYNFQAYELIGSCMFEKAINKSKIIHFSVGKPWNFKTKLSIIKLYYRYSVYLNMKKIVKKELIKAYLFLPFKCMNYVFSKISRIFKGSN